MHLLQAGQHLAGIALRRLAVQQRGVAVGLVRFAMANPHLQRSVNAVAPEAVTQARFAQALAASFGRRVWLGMPALPLRTLMREMATLLLDGQNVVPSAALANGYRFVHPQLAEALSDLAQRQTRQLLSHNAQKFE